MVQKSALPVLRIAEKDSKLHSEQTPASAATESVEPHPITTEMETGPGVANGLGSQREDMQLRVAGSLQCCSCFWHRPCYASRFGFPSGRCNVQPGLSKTSLAPCAGATPQQSNQTEVAELSAAVGAGATELQSLQASRDQEAALQLKSVSAGALVPAAVHPAPTGRDPVSEQVRKQARLTGTRLVKQSFLSMNMATADFQRVHCRMQCPARQGHWTEFLEHVGNPSCHEKPLECKACLHVKETLQEQAQALRPDTQGHGSTTHAEAATPATETALVKRPADAEPSEHVQEMPCKRRRGRPNRQEPRIDLYEWLREERPGKYRVLCTEARKEDIPMQCLVFLGDDMGIFWSSVFFPIACVCVCASSWRAGATA